MPKKRGNNEGSIRQRKDGTWEGRYISGYGTDGKPKRKSLFGKTKDEAQKKLREALTQLDRGEYVEPSKMTVGQWLDIWFWEYAKPHIRTSTATSHWSNIESHLKPALGKQLLQKLRTDQVQAFINKQVKQGLAPATLRKQMAPLKSAMKQAAENQLILRNPVSFVRMPKLEQEEIQFLRIEEQQGLIKALPPTTAGRALRFILGTGLRASELCGLRWKDIMGDEFTVKQVISSVKDIESKEYRLETNKPKTKAGQRTIPLLPSMMTLLDVQRKVQKEERMRAGELWTGGMPGQGETYVFASAVGTPIDRNNMSRTLRAALDKAELKRRGVHALRHTFATNWVRTGKDLRSLSEILGHTNVAFTMQRYVHSEMETKRAAMRAMESLL